MPLAALHRALVSPRFLPRSTPLIISLGSAFVKPRVEHGGDNQGLHRVALPDSESRARGILGGTGTVLELIV